ncbi:major capsid protein [Stutzerimonas kirkiae]|uniref:major capsid protein n=1 Tax=Stutzerimonas kirkiae TaxID=2211392 RepID=UPI00103835E3|nr:major capsid protein [Stutzerimonas kirkiae]TBV08432.1 hypothetical protein DNK08_11000 [Stutzerimonas kirkiae]TBV16708.1 hypothetical protein DNK01_02310 [Stutzerimonas kirkiae]
MELRNLVKKYGRKFASVSILGSAVTGQAFADAADAAATISGGTSDVNTIGWAGIGVLAAAVLFKYIRRAF